MPRDELRVAVRPRGMLECLDLAVMVCGRWPLALATAAIAGALPCVLVNRALFASLDEQSMLLAWVVLGVEAAWAAMPLTLVLGQAVFSSRFSWPEAWRALRGGLPALLLFQGILRGLCLTIWVLAPVVFVGMYYLNQIVLLERPRVWGVWRRLGAINRGSQGRVFTLGCIDALLLTLGTTLGTRMLAAATSLWHDRGISWEAIADGDSDAIAALFSWHGQIAFWTTCGFLTVFRFFTYLDGRIRREGWDVELRLRAEDTYAGLARPAGPRRAPAAVVLVVAAVLAATAGDILAGEPSAAATGRARQALAHQSFPWYDAAADRYRPLLQSPGVEREASWRRATTQQEPARIDPALPTVVGHSIMLGLLVAALVGLTILVIRSGLDLRPPTAEPAAGPPVAPVAAPNPALPEGLRLGAGDLLTRITAAAARGDFTVAMLHLHAWMLLELDRQGGLVLDRGKTANAYCREVAIRRPDVAGVFRSSSRLFERAFFGRLPIDEAAFREIWEHRDRIVTSGVRTGEGR